MAERFVECSLFFIAVIFTLVRLMLTSMKNYRYQRAKHLSIATQYTQYTLDTNVKCSLCSRSVPVCVLVVPFLLSIPSFSNCVYVYTVPLLLFACIMFSHFHFPLSTFWHRCTSGTLSNVSTIWLQLWLYVEIVRAVVSYNVTRTLYTYKCQAARQQGSTRCGF